MERDSEAKATAKAYAIEAENEAETGDSINAAPGAKPLRAAGVFLLAVLLLILAACGSKGEAPLKISEENLIENAKKERYLYTVSMPDTWANWKETWQDLQELYGISHQDTDMSSAEELKFFRNSQNTPRDLGDVGKTYAIQAERENLLLKYKTSYWDEIPDWAKDDDGDWILSYTGTISFISNDRKVPHPPTSWADVEKGDYSVTIGDVISGAQSQYAVLSSAYAFGGGVDNIRPGVDFWKELARRGRLDKAYSRVDRIVAGETDLMILLDFNCLNYQKEAKEKNPSLSYTVTIPQDGSLSIGYATILSRNASHPHAAALAREYILSDAGQLNLAKGFARPIRSVAVPEEIAAQMIPQEQYKNVIHLEDEEKLKKAIAQIVDAWANEILPMIYE